MWEALIDTRPQEGDAIKPSKNSVPNMAPAQRKRDYGPFRLS